LRFAEGKKRPSTAVKRVATKRLSVDPQGRVMYRYKQPCRDGSTHVVLEPLDFVYGMEGMPRAQGCAGAAMARLAALGVFPGEPRRSDVCVLCFSPRLRHYGCMSKAMSQDSSNSAVWKNHVTAPDSPEGFSVRTTYPTNPTGVEVMLEQWEQGTSEPPHSHPGDDMTVVVEGKMSVQFFTRQVGRLVPDGEPLILERGDTGYIAAGRIHSADYIERCKLVYVHEKAFGFVEEG
jgi:quercetin dioxygenase-like cupin family protein